MVPARVGLPRPVAALELKGTNILVSDLANVIEGLELPSAVRVNFPDLTDDQWSAGRESGRLIWQTYQCASRPWRGRLAAAVLALGVGHGRALPAAVGVALDDEFVTGADETVDGGLGEQRVCHVGQPLIRLPVGGDHG